jgi:hypothetical protein
MATFKEYWVTRGSELYSKSVSREVAEQKRQQAQTELAREGLSAESVTQNTAEIKEVKVVALSEEKWLAGFAVADVEQYRKNKQEGA